MRVRPVLLSPSGLWCCGMTFSNLAPSRDSQYDSKNISALLPYEERLNRYFDNLRRSRRLSLFAVLLFVALTPSVFAQATRETLQYLGTSQLDSVAATTIASDDLQISPHPESDAELAGVNRGPGPASVPLITVPQSVSPAQKNVALAFNGLTHRDQRFAGTGLYANTQFSTEPPDEGLAAG